MVYLYIACATLSWALLDLLRKLSVKHISHAAIIFLMSVGQAIVATLWAFSSLNELWFTESYILWAVLSITFNLAIQYLFLRAIEMSSFSQTVPFLALVPVFSLLVSQLIGEVPTVQQAIGVFVVCIGGFSLSSDDTETKTAEKRNLLLRRWQALLQNKGGVVMLFAVMLWGALGVVDKVALRHVSPHVHAIVIAYALTLFYGVISAHSRSITLQQVFSRLGVKAIALPLAAASGLIFTLLAIRDFPVAFYEAIARSFAAFSGVTFGAFLFGEHVHLQQVIAVMLMSVGVVLILL